MLTSKLQPFIVTVFALLTASFAVPSIGQTAAGMSADEAAIREGSGSWPVAHNAGNIDKMLAVYTDDAVVMPPDAPSVKGHRAIRAFLSKDVAEAKAAGITIKDVNREVGISGISLGTAESSRSLMRQAKRWALANTQRSGEERMANGS
jgi:hypothetical protein